MSTLALVATPLGNLAELTPRAVEALRTAKIIFCEDTRHFARLADHWDIATHRVSFHQHSNPAKVVDLLNDGNDAALVCDAGTPSISDPGERLVRAVLDAGHIVSPVGINTACIAALICSGFPTARFAFWGFIPNKKGRQTFINSLAEQSHTTVFYESTHRILKFLKMTSELQPQLQFCVAKELTKLHEQFFRGTAAEILAIFEADAQLQKGEFVVVSAPQNWLEPV